MTFPPTNYNACSVRIKRSAADRQNGDVTGLSTALLELPFDGSLAQLEQLLPLAVDGLQPRSVNQAESFTGPFAIGALFRIKQPEQAIAHTITLDQRGHSGVPGPLERVLAYCASLGRGNGQAALLLYESDLGDDRARVYLPPRLGDDTAEGVSYGTVEAGLYPQTVAVRLHRLACDPADVEIIWTTLRHAIELDVFYTAEAMRLQFALSPEYFSRTDAAYFERTIRDIWEDIKVSEPTLRSANVLPRRTEFVERVLANCRDKADETFIVDAGRSHSWREFHQRALAIAERLVSSDDRSGYTAVLVRPGFDFVAAVFGAIFAGKAFVPLVDKLGDERITYILGRSQIRTLIVDEGHQATAERLQALNAITLLALENLPAHPTDAPPPVEDASNVIYRMFTSGSTGDPKAVDVTFANYLALVESYADLLPDFGELHWGFTGTPVFDSSTKQYLYPALCGTRVVVPAVSVDHNVVSCARELAERGVSVLNMTPALIQLLLEQQVPLHGFNYILTGGEALSIELYERILVATGKPNLMNMYGPTEATVNATGYIGNLDKHFLIAVPIGTAISGAHTMVVDSGLAPVRPGCKGELLLNGPLVTAGYPTDPAKTAEKFIQIDGALWYRTGDQVVEWFDGNLYYFGRDDGQVKLNGVRIELGEIRTKLAGLCDTPLAEVLLADGRLIAVYKRATTFSATELNALRESARAALPSFVRVSQFLCVADLPLTVQGKTDVRRLRQLADEAMSAVATKTADLAHSPRQRALLQAIDAGLSARLSGMQYDHTISLYEQGADSLTMLRILLEIEQVIGYSVAAQALYHAPGFAALERLLDTGMPTVTNGWDRVTGNQPVVVLFPPVLGDPAIFRALVDDPVLAHCAFVTCSYPGMTSPQARSASIAALAQSIADEIGRAASARRLVLVGYSMGCIVAAETACRLPETVQVEHVMLLDKGPTHSLLTPTIESQLQDSLRFLHESISQRDSVPAELLAHMRSYVEHNTIISHAHQMSTPDKIAEAAVCFMCTRDGESFRDVDWKPYFSRFELIRIACGHGDIVYAPWVSEVATTLCGLTRPTALTEWEPAPE